jgi:hypothetical protein
VVAEAFAEIGAARPCLTATESTIDRYLALSLDALEITGARDFPPAPLTLVRSE